MAFISGLGQRQRDASAHPDHRGLLDAELDRDRISCLKADPADVLGQPIGVLGHHLNGVATIGLVDPHRPCRADAMAMQEDHNLADNILLSPGVGDPAGSDRADALDLAQPIPLDLDDVEDPLAEHLDHLFGIGRPDAADHARSQILLDALKRGGLRTTQ